MVWSRSATCRSSRSADCRSWPQREAFQVTLDESAKKNPKAKQAKLEQFYDNSLVQELVKEGFFVSLWGR